MGTFLNNDDAIWLKNVNADEDTMALLRQLRAGTRLKLEIEDTRGDWQRMANGKDGRPTFGLKTCWPGGGLLEDHEATERPASSFQDRRSA